MSTLGERVREARIYAKLKQGELAKAIGVSQSAISQLEKGSAKKSKYTSDIADATGVHPDWLAKAKGDMIWRDTLTAEFAREPPETQKEALTVARALKEQRGKP